MKRLAQATSSACPSRSTKRGTAGAVAAEQAPPVDERAPGLFDAPGQAPLAVEDASPADEAAQSLGHASAQDADRDESAESRSA